MIGGDGDRLLALAARRADVGQLTGFAHRPGGTDHRHFGSDGLADRVAVAEVRDQVLELRDRHGVTDVAVFDGRSVAFDDVVADLSGR